MKQHEFIKDLIDCLFCFICITFPPGILGIFCAIISLSTNAQIHLCIIYFLAWFCITFLYMFWMIGKLSNR